MVDEYLATWLWKLGTEKLFMLIILSSLVLKFYSEDNLMVKVEFYSAKFCREPVVFK